jgi:hypothetical protein
VLRVGRARRAQGDLIQHDGADVVPTAWGRESSGRDFRLLWAGESISTLGSQFHIVALAIVALQIGGGIALRAVLTAAALPRAALMLIRCGSPIAARRGL